jgi:hypothetical protein
MRRPFLDHKSPHPPTPPPVPPKPPTPALPYRRHEPVDETRANAWRDHARMLGLLAMMLAVIFLVTVAWRWLWLFYVSSRGDN